VKTPRRQRLTSTESSSAPAASAFDYIGLGIDPGTATTGYGVVALTPDGAFVLLAYGVFRTAAHTPMHLRLRELFDDICGLIAEFQPQGLAVEKLFFGRNVTNAISVGQARGIVLLAAALHHLEVAEYTPAEVKQAIAGYGNAEKAQVQTMVQRILNLPDLPRPDDAADGVAIAVCHLQGLHFRRRTASP
jgi:crossover junction endodeoxyribonuclease RuvC